VELELEAGVVELADGVVELDGCYPGLTVEPSTT
jgi:hypothetical protein